MMTAVAPVHVPVDIAVLSGEAIEKRALCTTLQTRRPHFSDFKNRYEGLSEDFLCDTCELGPNSAVLQYRFRCVSPRILKLRVNVLSRCPEIQQALPRVGPYKSLCSAAECDLCASTLLCAQGRDGSFSHRNLWFLATVRSLQSQERLLRARMLIFNWS